MAASVELHDDTVISLRSWVFGAATWRENSYYLAITPLHLSPSAIISWKYAFSFRRFKIVIACSTKLDSRKNDLIKVILMQGYLRQPQRIQKPILQYFSTKSALASAHTIKVLLQKSTFTLYNCRALWNKLTELELQVIVTGYSKY